MALSGFVNEAKKTNKLMAELANQKEKSEESIIDVSDGQGIPEKKLKEFREKQSSGLPSQAREQGRAIPSNKAKTDFEKQYLSRQRDYEVSRPSKSRQEIDDRHCKIVADVIKKSGTSTSGDTNWENCKYKKDCDGQVYCTEFHSFCGKEKCRRATK
jgi:hypothetical protein